MPRTNVLVDAETVVDVDLWIAVVRAVVIEGHAQNGRFVSRAKRAQRRERERAVRLACADEARRHLGHGVVGQALERTRLRRDRPDLGVERSQPIGEVARARGREVDAPVRTVRGLHVRDDAAAEMGRAIVGELAKIAAVDADLVEVERIVWAPAHGEGDAAAVVAYGRITDVCRAFGVRRCRQVAQRAGGHGRLEDPEIRPRPEVVVFEGRRRGDRPAHEDDALHDWRVRAERLLALAFGPRHDGAHGGIVEGISRRAAAKKDLVPAAVRDAAGAQREALAQEARQEGIAADRRFPCPFILERREGRQDPTTPRA